MAYAERIANVVRTQSSARRSRLADKVIADIGQDAKRIQALEDLARRSATNTAGLDAQLKEIEDSKSRRGEAAVTEDRVRVLYNTVLTAASDAHEQMLSKKIIGRGFYWTQVRSPWPFVAAIVLIAVVWFGYCKLDHQDYVARYDLWRVGKKR